MHIITNSIKNMYFILLLLNKMPTLSCPRKSWKKSGVSLEGLKK